MGGIYHNILFLAISQLLSHDSFFNSSDKIAQKHDNLQILTSINVKIKNIP